MTWEKALEELLDDTRMNHQFREHASNYWRGGVNFYPAMNIPLLEILNNLDWAS